MGRFSAKTLRKQALAGAKNDTERRLVEFIHQLLTMPAPQEPLWKSEWMQFSDDLSGVVYRDAGSDGSGCLSLQIGATSKTGTTEIDNLLVRALELYPDCLVRERGFCHLLFCIEAEPETLRPIQANDPAKRARKFD